jgi:hypothetical protein
MTDTTTVTISIRQLDTNHLVRCALGEFIFCISTLTLCSPSFLACTRLHSGPPPGSAIFHERSDGRVTRGWSLSSKFRTLSMMRGWPMDVCTRAQTPLMAGFYYR